MSPVPQEPNPERKNRVLADVHKDKQIREQSYREQALKLFPHVCERCGREFSGKRLRELTVHHKDNNHFNNPPDGSNWALLCLYCHDDEHGTLEQRGIDDQTPKGVTTETSLGYNAFEGLKDLLPDKDDDQTET